MSYAKDCRATVIPAMRYREAHKAIDWLVKAFGFEKKVVYDAPDGTVAHAELTFGNGMVMLGSARDDEHGKRMAQPEEIGGRETQTAYIIVSDGKAAYEMAKAAGAEMVMELQEMSYGGWAFRCRDLEGHMWSFGEYDPWVPAES